jgi:ribosome recycling factor
MTNEYQEKFQAALEHFQGEAATLRTGRATPALIEQLPVECYGGKTPLNQLASISAPEPRMIVIQPWDPTVTKDIERAIQTSPLGLQPSIDGQIIRLILPALTEERRRELLKVLGQFEEAAKVAMKRAREETLNVWKESERAGDLSEDARARSEKDLQKQLEDYHEKLKALVEEKTADIMTV